MPVTIQPSLIRGIIKAPPSKSCMQRACAAALLHNGTTTLFNVGNSKDEQAAQNIIKNLGAAIRNIDEETLQIYSKGLHFVTNHINCGESGLSLRMFVPIAALTNNQITLTGEGSLLQRPMNFFVDYLPLLGVDVHTIDGKLPITVTGPLCPANIIVDGSLSSQFITGLLMAYAACNTNATIHVTKPTSKPYINLTLDILQHFGFQVPINNNFTQFTFLSQEKSGVQHIDYTIEGDWSSTSFLLVAAAIGGSITVNGLQINSSQADVSVINALERAGCIINKKENEISVTSGKLNSFEFDATDCPDLFPPLVALAAYCDGTSILHGVNRLQYKESNRGLTLQKEFGKMGITIDIADNTMFIKGGEVNGAIVESHNDHRIAMSTAVAALGAKGNTTILQHEAVSKSYPAFFEHLQMLQTFE